MTSQDTMPTTEVVIILEDLNAKMDAVVEQLTAMENHLIRRMDEKFAQQDKRFDAIESILGVHSALLKEHDQILHA